MLITIFQSGAFDPGKFAIFFHESNPANHPAIFKIVEELDLKLTIEVASQILGTPLDSRYTYLGAVINLNPAKHNNDLLQKINLIRLLLSQNLLVYACSDSLDLGNDNFNQIIEQELSTVYCQNFYRVQGNTTVALTELLDELHQRLQTARSKTAKIYRQFIRNQKSWN